MLPHQIIKRTGDESAVFKAVQSAVLDEDGAILVL